MNLWEIWEGAAFPFGVWYQGEECKRLDMRARGSGSDKRLCIALPTVELLSAVILASVKFL